MGNDTHKPMERRSGAALTQAPQLDSPLIKATDLLNQEVAMFWWIVTPFGLFATLVLGTFLMLRFSPSDPYPLAGDDVDL